MRATFTTPKPAARDIVVYEWEANFDYPIVCHLEYEPADGDGWNEPRTEARMVLCVAYLVGQDITNALTQDQIEEIERDSFVDLAAEAQEARAEAAWDRQQERINEGDYL